MYIFCIYFLRKSFNLILWKRNCLLRPEGGGVTHRSKNQWREKLSVRPSMEKHLPWRHTHTHSTHGHYQRPLESPSLTRCIIKSTPWPFQTPKVKKQRTAVRQRRISHNESHAYTHTHTLILFPLTHTVLRVQN